MDLVLLAGYAFDAMDRMEKLMLAYQGETKKQIAVLEDVLSGQKPPSDFVAPARVNLSNPAQVKVCLQSLKHRVMDGMPVTAGELRIVLFYENSAYGALGSAYRFTGPYYHQFYDGPQQTIFSLHAYSDSQPGEDEIAKHIQRIKGLYDCLPTADPYGYPLGPFHFGQQMRVPAELKEAFKNAAMKLEVDPAAPDDLKKIVSGLRDETFWGPYK